MGDNMRIANIKYYKLEEKYRKKLSKSFRKSYRSKLKRIDLSDGSSYKGYMIYKGWLN